MKRIGISKHSARIGLTALAAVVALATVAFAYFSSTGTGKASATAGVLGAPTITSTSSGAGTVTLNWSAVTPPSSAGSVKYYVSRNGGAPSSACPSSTSPAAVTSCTDTGLAKGTYSYTVTAVWQSWTATSAPASSVSVSSGALDHFVLTPASGSETAGSPFAVTLTAQDASNNTVTAYTGTVHFTSSDSQAVLPADYTFTTGSGADNGMHQFTNGVTLKTASSASTVTVTGDSKSVTGTYAVTAGTPATVSVSSGSGQATPINTAFGSPLVAKVVDSYGNPVAGASVTFAAPATSASASFNSCAGGNPSSASCVVTTDSAGVASSSTLTANGTAGSYSVTASATSGTPASFSLTNQKASQTITFTSTAPTNATVGGSTYTPTATASSGLPVSFSIDSSASSVCSISGSTVSFNAAGTCVIDANQSGNSNYNAAPQVQQSFKVATTPPDVSITYPINNTTYGAGSWTGAITGTATPHGGTSIASTAVAVEDTTTTKWWSNGSFGASSQTFVPATGTTSWNLPVASGSLSPGHSYTVIAQATDSVGNTGTSTTVSFTYSGAAAVTVIGQGAAKASSINSVKTTNGATDLIVIYCWGGSACGSTGSTPTITGPFSSISAANPIQSIVFNGNTKSCIEIVQAIGNGSTGPVSVSFSGGTADSVGFVNVLELSSGATVKATGINPSTQTQSTSPVATLSTTSGLSELAIIGLDGNSGNDTITAPSGFTALTPLSGFTNPESSSSIGAAGGNLGMYYSPNAQLSATFTLSPTAVDWGTVALGIG